jgi:8-oxo-dGTP pyrophosphatase MutT (NUDIX family)
MHTLEKLKSNYARLFPDELNTILQIEKLLWGVLPETSVHRSTFPAHFTASAIVLDRQTVSLIWHPILHAWFQPGGHIEAGETPLDASRREAFEELGCHCVVHPWHLRNLHTPFDIDVHTIPANNKRNEPEHWHIDLRFLFDVDTTKARIKPELEIKSLPILEIERQCPTLTKVANKLRKQIGHFEHGLTAEDFLA